MFNRVVRVFISGIMIGWGPAEGSTHVQSSEPHVAQKFVAIPPDLDSLLQEELLNSQIQSALLFFATSIYALCHCCYAQGLLCCSILYEARCYCRPCLAVLYCIVEAHPPFVDSISLQALLNSFFATRYQTHQVPYAVSNSKSLKWKSINCAHT